MQQDGLLQVVDTAGAIPGWSAALPLDDPAQTDGWRGCAGPTQICVSSEAMFYAAVNVHGKGPHRSSGHRVPPHACQDPSSSVITRISYRPVSRPKFQPGCPAAAQEDRVCLLSFGEADELGFLFGGCSWS